MKRKNIWWIIALAVFGSLLLITCDMEPKNPFEGVWKTSQGYTVTFKDTTWDLPYYSSGELDAGLRGTYTYAENTASITYTEIAPQGINWRHITIQETYNLATKATVSGNKLTWGASTYTKQ
jgi:hypothetical protein